MIKVSVGNNLSRSEVFYEDTSTIQEVLDAQGIDTEGNMVYLNGAAIPPQQFVKRFTDFGVTDSCTLISVIKQTGA